MVASAAELLELGAATPPDEVRQRQGPGGKMLDYIDARFVMDRLDAVVGPGNWQDAYADREDGSVRGGIGIATDAGWVWKWDIGTQSDIEPEKGSYSEAFKRAGVKWGIGRDLYSHTPSGRAAPRPAPAQSGPAAVPSSSAVGPDDPPFPGFENDGGSRCPIHDKPWRTNSRGFYCATKVGDGWCQEQPSAQFKARNEVA